MKKLSCVVVSHSGAGSTSSRAEGVLSTGWSRSSGFAGFADRRPRDVRKKVEIKLKTLEKFHICCARCAPLGETDPEC
jgi:hypothetical protein